MSDTTSLTHGKLIDREVTWTIMEDDGSNTLRTTRYYAIIRAVYIGQHRLRFLAENEATGELCDSLASQVHLTPLRD